MQVVHTTTFVEVVERSTVLGKQVYEKYIETANFVEQSSI
jgi:phage-related protein